MADNLKPEDLKYFREAELFAAQAKHEKAVAAKAKIELDEAKRKAAEAAAANDRNHVMSIETGINKTQTFRDTLDQWHRLDPDAAWTIIMNSPGGSVIDGMALFDHIVQHSKRGGGTHHITIKTRGWAASMGGILTQAGDVRVMGSEAFLLIHKVSSMAGGSVDQIEDELKLLKKMCERVENIFVERSGGKLSRAVLRRNWTRADWWIDSNQALKLGLVDKIG